MTYLFRAPLELRANAGIESCKIALSRNPGKFHQGRTFLRHVNVLAKGMWWLRWNRCALCCANDQMSPWKEIYFSCRLSDWYCKMSLRGKARLYSLGMSSSSFNWGGIASQPGTALPPLLALMRSNVAQHQYNLQNKWIWGWFGSKEM